MSTTVSRRDPLLAELDAMSDGFERMFGVRGAQAGSRGFVPVCDIWESEHDVVIELDAPGLHTENISAEVINGHLIVAGERQPSEGACRRYRTERWQGRFVRTFSVPRGVNGDQIVATYREGVLEIRLPKPEEAKPKRISITHRDAAQTIEA